MPNDLAVFNKKSSSKTGLFPTFTASYKSISILSFNGNTLKLFTLILGIVAILPLLLTSIYSILELPGIKDTYNTLDFSHVAEEIYDEYNPSTFAFDFGYIFYIISLVFVVIYLITIITNYIVRRRIENV